MLDDEFIFEPDFEPFLVIRDELIFEFDDSDEEEE